uniref:Histidine-containing phosphotransfer protein n=1 Tax=Hordeum vulgare subsp. vulgare TaxID=112509 RepID=A0A8I7B6M8_HORVV
MADAALRDRLNTLVTSMFATDMLDENFHQLKSMEEDGTAAPGYVADIINLFISNTKRILNDIAALLNQPVVDFDMVDVLVRQLKGCSYRPRKQEDFDSAKQTAHKEKTLVPLTTGTRFFDR